MMKESMKKVFEQCINQFNTEKCPDQIIGTCKIGNSGFEFIENLIPRDVRKNNVKCNIENIKGSSNNILIILESPHKDEYKDKECIAPALGKTGINLNKKFKSKIDNVIGNLENKVNLNGEYKLVLVNAIQYPTSLGFSTSNFRDRIWLNLWITKEFRKNLVERIKEYSPSIIINLCTNGSHKENPFVYDENSKDITMKFLENIFEDDDKFEIKKDVSEIYYDGTRIYYDGSDSLTNIRLKMFVQNAIEEYQNNNNKVVCLIGTHPSSWSENDESELKFL